jgi:hypothetical protein
MRRPWGIPEKRKPAREAVVPLSPMPVAVAGGVQAIFAFVFRAGKPAKASYLPAVSAGQVGVTAGRDIGGSTINTLPSPEASRR